jgi:hypothetical protein
MPSTSRLQRINATIDAFHAQDVGFSFSLALDLHNFGGDDQPATAAPGTTTNDGADNASSEENACLLAGESIPADVILIVVPRELTLEQLPPRALFGGGGGVGGNGARMERTSKQAPLLEPARTTTSVDELVTRVQAAYVGRYMQHALLSSSSSASSTTPRFEHKFDHHVVGYAGASSSTCSSTVTLSSSVHSPESCKPV